MASNIPRQDGGNLALTYAGAGVDIDAGDALVERIKPLAAMTRRAGANADLGGFGGLFDLAQCGFRDPVLVSGTDGVGTKLRLAIQSGLHDGIGIDLVAMCANDVLAQGASPLFFLDYFACGRLDVDVAERVIAGIARGCVEAGCALIGGETAEMPGMYAPGDYDLAGFCVGGVEREAILPRRAAMVATDVLLALPSSGIHANGFSLVRRVIERSGLDLGAQAPFDPGQSLAAAVLVPTRLYQKPLAPALTARIVKGLAHITGGGLTENVPRMLPPELTPRISHEAIPFGPVFDWLQREGAIVPDEMRRTFNCGVGMVACVAAADVPQALSLLGAEAFVLGDLVSTGA
jgi:phosphoribosylaminoimidazole synthetase